MKNFNKKCNAALFAVLIGALLQDTGCSRTSSTTTTSTEVRRDPAYSEESTDGESSTVEVTKTEEVTKEDNHRGFFGIIGDIIALPFRAIAAIL